MSARPAPPRNMPITGRRAVGPQRSAISSRATICGAEVGLGQRDQPLERVDRVAARAEVQRDEVGLAARKHRDRRRLVAEMAAIVKLGQRRLDRPVAAVDDQHLGPHLRDGPHRLADLVGVLDLIVEDVRVVGAIFADARQLRDIAGRLGIGQQGDPRAGHSAADRAQAAQARAGAKLRFWHDFRVPSAIATTIGRAAVQLGATVHCAFSAGFAAKSWCWDDKIAPTVADRPLSRATIAVPLIGTLMLAAMLLVLDKMLRLFEFVVDGGRSGQRRLADARQPAPGIFLARHPDRPDARHPARLPQAGVVVGARRPARHRRRASAGSSASPMPTRSRCCF